MFRSKRSQSIYNKTGTKKTYDSTPRSINNTTNQAQSKLNPTPTKSDGRFDLNQYIGKWYEVARLPTTFQQQCARSIAEYGEMSPDIDGLPRISVKNSCLNMNN